jgi:hypothetical protein
MWREYNELAINIKSLEVLAWSPLCNLNYPKKNLSFETPQNGAKKGGILDLYGNNASFRKTKSLSLPYKAVCAIAPIELSATL